MNGNIYLNGDIINRPEILAISGFVPQEDISVVSLTVYEHMSFMVGELCCVLHWKLDRIVRNFDIIFQAVLKMDKRISELDRIRKIISLMNQLGLDNCASTQIRSLSGGQRKRLSIAVQVRFQVR